MLLPRYSLRSILIGITGCAGFSLILRTALQGHAWAIGISAGVASILILLLFHALVFFIISVLSAWVGTQELPARTSQGGLQSNPDHQIALNPNETHSG